MMIKVLQHIKLWDTFTKKSNGTIITKETVLIHEIICVVQKKKEKKIFKCRTENKYKKERRERDMKVYGSYSDICAFPWNDSSNRINLRGKVNS